MLFFHEISAVAHSLGLGSRKHLATTVVRNSELVRDEFDSQSVVITRVQLDLVRSFKSASFT